MYFQAYLLNPLSKIKKTKAFQARHMARLETLGLKNFKCFSTEFQKNEVEKTRE